MDQGCKDALGLYQRRLSRGVVEYLEKQMRVKFRQSIYTAWVVIWLMILQRLQPRGTLATSLEALLEGVADWLLSQCVRATRTDFAPYGWP